MALTVGPLAASAGVNFQMRPFTDSAERIAPAQVPAQGVAPAGLAACSIVPFGVLRVFVALIPDKYPDEVHSFTTPLPQLVASSPATPQISAPAWRC